MRLFKIDHSGTDKLLARRNWCEVWLAQGAAKPRNNTHLKEFAEGVQPGDLVFSLRVEVNLPYDLTLEWVGCLSGDLVFSLRVEVNLPHDLTLE